MDHLSLVVSQWQLPKPPSSSRGEQQLQTQGALSKYLGASNEVRFQWHWRLKMSPRNTNWVKDSRIYIIINIIAYIYYMYIYIFTTGRLVAGVVFLGPNGELSYGPICYPLPIRPSGFKFDSKFNVKNMWFSSNLALHLNQHSTIPMWHCQFVGFNCESPTSHPPQAVGRESQSPWVGRDSVRLCWWLCCTIWTGRRCDKEAPDEWPLEGPILLKGWHTNPWFTSTSWPIFPPSYWSPRSLTASSCHLRWCKLL